MNNHDQGIGSVSWPGPRRDRRARWRLRADPDTLAERLQQLPAECGVRGKHAARVVLHDGQWYVVKLDRESALSYLAYWVRIRHLNLLADDFVEPLTRRARIRAATLSMREWRARGFGAPEPLNGPEDDCLCYRYLRLPGLRERLRADADPLALLAAVTTEIYRRHAAAEMCQSDRGSVLYHLDSRCANILLDGDRPVWLDFDRGFTPGTPPLLLRARELVTFCRSAARQGDPNCIDQRLNVIVRHYPHPAGWRAAIDWLRRSSTVWQEPAARLRRRRSCSFQKRADLANRLERILGSES
jgi:hypothetical protein